MSEQRTREEHVVPEEAISSHVNSGPGSSAYTTSEDWVRENSRPEDHDGRAPTRTYFSYADAPTEYPPWQRHRKPREKRSWKVIAGWQDGVNSDISRGGQNWWADKQRWIETFGDRMGATTYHRDRAKHVLENIDLQRYQSGRIPVEQVIVGILSLLIDADINDFEMRSYAREDTRSLLDDLDMDVGDYERIRKLIREYHKDVLFPEHE